MTPPALILYYKTCSFTIDVRPPLYKKRLSP